MNVKGSITNQKPVIGITGESNMRYENTVADDAIKASILQSLHWYAHLPCDDISVTVKSGYVELIGHVQWLYQKMVISAMIQKIEGVKGIINGIVAANRLNPTLVH